MSFSDIAQYDYNLQEIRESLDDSQIFDLLLEFGGEPSYQRGAIVSRTICHHKPEEECSCKLYYYSNSKLFRCYTACSDSWDVFELVRKVKSLETNAEVPLPAAIEFVASRFGFSKQTQTDTSALSIVNDLKYFNSYDRIKDIDLKTQTVELKFYDGNFLKNLPLPSLPWEKEGITKEICKTKHIKYNPKNGSIVIPHYDLNDNLIGIRERELTEDRIDLYGKYHPAYFNGQMYNHPLSFSLYNLNFSKDNIAKRKQAIIFEGEKSTLKFASIYGIDNDISVACTGSNIIPYQVSLLTNLGVNEIIVALDHDFEDVKSQDASKIIKNLKNIHSKYGNMVKISMIWDRENLTKLKESPIDAPQDIFEYLWKNRINLYI